MKTTVFGACALLASSTGAWAWPDYTQIVDDVIPDFNAPMGMPGLLESTIDVNNNFTITDVNVSFHSLYHSWAGDLIIRLQKIGGPTAELVSRVGSIGGTFGSSSDYDGDYTFDSQSAANIWTAAMGNPFPAAIAPGTYTTSGPGTTPPYGAPNNSLNAFNGLNANGQWRLTITDASSVNTGYLYQWTLTIAPCPGGVALLGLAGLPGRRQRRRPLHSL